MKLICLLLFLMFLTGCGSATFTIARIPNSPNIECIIKEIHEEWIYDSSSMPISKIIYYDTQGKFIKHGFLEGWYNNGVKEYSIEFRNGKPTGNFIKWYKNGKVESLQTKTYSNKNDVIYSTSQSFYQNGKMHIFRVFDNKNLQGEAQFDCWYENGILQCHSFRKNFHLLNKRKQIQTKKKLSIYEKLTIWDTKGNKLANIILNVNNGSMIVKLWKKTGELFSDGIYKNGLPWNGSFIGGYAPKDNQEVIDKLIVYKNGKLLKTINDVPNELLLLPFFPYYYFTEINKVDSSAADCSVHK